jgi:type IV pilus assembly protein PilM
MVGLGILFLAGDYRALAKVTTPQFKSAVDRANGVTARGEQFKKDYETAKGAWTAKNEEGKSLLIEPTNRALWPKFLQVISRYFPDPVRDYEGLNEDDPKDQPTIAKLRVHIDAIKPVYRTDLATEWFDELDPIFKRLMHQYDQDNPPEGEGWVIQIVAHHYNPFPDAEQGKLPINDPKRYEFGPYEYLTSKVLRKLNSPQLRLFGVTHVAVAWLLTDREWTTEKGLANNNLPENTVPLLDRTAPAVEEMVEGSAGGRGGRDRGDFASSRRGGGRGMGSGMGRGMGSGGFANRGRGRGGRDAEDDFMGGAGRFRTGGRGGTMGQEEAPKPTYLSRTDFLLQFVWKPVTPEPEPQNEEERKAQREARLEQLKEIFNKMNEAEKNAPAVTVPSVEALEKVSRDESTQLETAIEKATQEPTTKGAAGSGPARKGAAPPATSTPPAESKSETPNP